MLISHTSPPKHRHLPHLVYLRWIRARMHVDGVHLGLLMTDNLSRSGFILRSLVGVSEKRDFYWNWPETFGKIWAKVRTLVSRDSRKARKARYLRALLRLKIIFSKIRTGWLANQCLSHRVSSVFPCKQGILQGISRDLKSQRALIIENPCDTADFAHFPERINRENFWKNSEF
jgi:hypothetical protein